MKQKRIIVLVTLFVIILSTGLYLAYSNGLIFNTKDDEQEKINITENQKPNQNEEKVDDGIVYIEGVKTVNDIEISNITIKLVGSKKCELTADVKNTTDQYKEVTNLRIKIIDDSGEVDEIFGGGITELAAYEPNKLKTYALADITDAKDVIFEVIE